MVTILILIPFAAISQSLCVSNIQFTFRSKSFHSNPFEIPRRDFDWTSYGVHRFDCMPSDSEGFTRSNDLLIVRMTNLSNWLRFPPNS